MKPLGFLLLTFWPLCLQLIFLCSVNLLLVTASTSGNETDHWALLKFKESISNDPYDILASWNSSTHFCSCPGITCGHRHHQRITSLNLNGYGLHGFLSPHVGNLSFMRILSLKTNSFYGTIPQELGRLFRLHQLWLSNNSLVGEIPYNLTNCFKLWGLSLHYNNLIGNIPMEIGKFHKLEELYLSDNNFTGKFPASIWNLSSLRILSAAYNHLEGNIPKEISLLNLTHFTVPFNQLSGTLPSSLSNISSLKWYSIAGNMFNGFLPSNMFLTLPNLLIFDVGGNLLSGLIPASIINASKLLEIDVAFNRFVGQVPNLGVLPNLSSLNLAKNYLGSNSSQDWEFLKSLVNCTELTKVDLIANNFGGPLPNLIGNLSNQLIQLYLGGNQIYGRIPTTLGNLINLIILGIEKNKFTGNIPDTFGRFQKMQGLLLGGNKLSGKIPDVIGNLCRLFLLDLSQNMLEGNIPPSIGNCKNLQNLDLSKNNLGGPIPPEVVSLPSLSILLNLSQNSLSGSLPADVGKLENIGILDVLENRLSSDIPGTIGDCSSLEYLYLQGNSFQGNIPSSISSLKGLQLLDLSRNSLSKSIPKGLQDISGLKHLNISFNMLEGEVPKGGVFRNASALSINGNDKLCGGISELHLPPCPDQGHKQSKHHNLIQIIVITVVVGSVLLLSSVLAICWVKRRTRKPSSTPPTIDQFSKVSYQNLHRATNGFSDNNLIGSGCYGSVYKGNLESEENLVAIKVLNLQKNGAHKSFITECNAVKNIRHRNLVKTLTCCSSVDYKGLEFKALVFEYMTNGSLEQWLHPWIEGENQLRMLDLIQRLNILFDIASALHYLHCECEQPIIHCDLKPSNVLLDEDMVAHVSDFGLARILSTLNSTSYKQSSTIEIREPLAMLLQYGMGSKVSLQDDLYSFGILILEILTGGRPTDEMFKDGQNIHDCVKMAFPNNLFQIMDPTLVRIEESREEGIESLTILYPKEEKCLVSLFGMGLARYVESPRERLNVVDVIRELNQIRRIFLAGGINRD